MNINEPDFTKLIAELRALGLTWEEVDLACKAVIKAMVKKLQTDFDAEVWAEWGQPIEVYRIPATPTPIEAHDTPENIYNDLLARISK